MYIQIPEFNPTSDRILVRKITQETSKGGVLMPPSTKMLFEQGIVVKAGPGKYIDGVFVPVTLKEGDKVLFSGGSAADIRMESGETLWLMTESAVLGIVQSQCDGIVAAAAKLPSNIVTATAEDIESIPLRTADVLN